MLKSGIAEKDTVKQDCIAVGRHPGKAGGRGVSSGDPDSLNI